MICIEVERNESTWWIDRSGKYHRLGDRPATIWRGAMRIYNDYYEGGHLIDREIKSRARLD